MQLKDLKPNPKNPRRITDKKLSDLKESLDKFGDLSGFVFNRKTGTLIGGHQRSKVMPSDADIIIEHYHESPTPSRTVAEGYVLINGERFKYREVDADAEWEIQAMVAANRSAGEWDVAMLEELKVDLGELDLELPEEEEPEPEVSDEDQYIVTIECADEMEMETVYTEMTNRGLKCKLIR